MSAILSGIRRLADNDLVNDFGQFVALCIFVGAAAWLLGDVSLAMSAWRLGR